MTRVAGTIMLFDGKSEPLFLVDQTVNVGFVTAERDNNEEMTNLGVILSKLKHIGIDTSQLQLVDLVDVSHHGQHHTPLFVFALDSKEYVTVTDVERYTWTTTATFQQLLGNVTLEDIAGIRY